MHLMSSQKTFDYLYFSTFLRVSLIIKYSEWIIIKEILRNEGKFLL